MAKKKSLSYQAGERGINRVNLFDRGTRGLYVEYRDGTRKRIALGKISWDEGKRKADEIALQFRSISPNAPMSLGKLFDIYEREVTPTKSLGSQEHDRRRRKRFISFLGYDRKPESLSVRDWNRYITDRKKDVGEEVIRGDLAFLCAVLNWATIAGDGKGGTLLLRNPLKGLPFPKNDSPVRRVMTDDEYLKFRAASKPFGMELFAVLAHETGHRGASIRQLRWSDVDFRGKRIHWIGSHDKMGNDHFTPLTDEAVTALETARRNAMAIGDAFLFAGETGCMTAHRARHLFNLIARKSGLPKGKRYGWHSLRRKFANDLDGNASLKTIADLGGWKKPETVIRCYLKSNEGAQREALKHRKVVGN